MNELSWTTVIAFVAAPTRPGATPPPPPASAPGRPARGPASGSLPRGGSDMLGIVLAVIRVVFIVGIYPLSLISPSGWSWGTGHSHYLMMILGLYATLGVFLLIASRNPPAHRSLIWFTVWSSVVHAVIMAVHALRGPARRGHLAGALPALLGVAVRRAALTPRRRA